MDYGTDYVAVMFTIMQCLQMRAWLLSDQTQIFVLDSDDGVVPTDVPKAAEDEVLPTWAIILIPAVIFLIAMILIGIYAGKKKSA